MEDHVDEILDRALNAAQLAGASYADVRLVESRTQLLEVKNRRVSALQESGTLGLGVRVLVDGAWGFAASADPSTTEAERCATLAARVARASARFRVAPVALSPVKPAVTRWETPIEVDPFTVPLADKIALLVEATGLMEREAQVKVAQGSMQFWEDKKRFASTEGARIEQRIVNSGAGLTAWAVGADDLQVRSYPNSFGGQYESAGYELVRRIDLPGHAAETAAMAAALLVAPVCPAGVTTILLDGSQMSLQLHESCGHPTELDRALGHEANYAGTSFLTTDQLGKLRYGSDLVSIVTDATTPRGLGTFGFDDEGVPAQRADLVREGRFAGYLTSRETAPLVGLASNGTMRAESWAHIPLVRMTNVNLEPGAWKLADLIADTEDGIHMITNRSWSIDDKRYNFQFGTEVGYEIKQGKRGRLLKNCTYTGITPEFWNQCDAICDASDWEIWGTPNCGKGQPSQTMRTAQGASSARFRGVQVGVGARS
ncbi:MAG: TldD/PmbA family protein [Candidatus Eisenbacteria bacterium]|uniref:TldD/PmbA family protein n=1 Tax=Eiseniibacteriota bacterium TaxID=2212470 RepID=A0A538SQ18_UNCEI|nr:MAG: TldD/PmbA family protein [Candidatus Eisenbacteria bacterium]